MPDTPRPPEMPLLTLTQEMLDRLREDPRPSVRAAVVELDAQRAALATVTQELARWKVCDLCEEPMEVPGFCHKGLTESEEAYQFMLDQAQTRCEQAEADLATARARLAAVQELLDDGGYCDCESEPCSCFGGAVAEALTADAAARSGKE